MLKVILKALVVVGGAVAGGYVIKNAEKIKQHVIDLQENDEVELDDEYETICNCMDLPTFKDHCCGNCENCKCHENEHQITLEEFMNKCNCENCDHDGDEPCCQGCNGCNYEDNEE